MTADTAKLDISFLPVSSLSLLGICQFKFFDALFGLRFETPLMRAGTYEHGKLYGKAAQLSEQDIIAMIKSGKKFTVREFNIKDTVTKIIGRIDQMDFLGNRGSIKNPVIIIDDKFPSTTPSGISNYYKIQLAAYATSVADSELLSSICDVVGAELRIRRARSDEILKSFQIGKDDLSRLSENIQPLAYTAWQIAQRILKPQHKKYDIEVDEWLECDHSTF